MAALRDRRWWLVVLAAAVVATLTLIVWLWPEEPVVPAAPSPDPTPTVTEPNRMPLTGVVTQQVPARPALLVKVSNSPEARPQTGLERADVVIEELTEGGITRFMAIFHSDLPEVVGPVRSARPVDAQLASGFGRPGLVFSGARPEVIALLGATPAVSITEGDPAFFRDDGRYASHPVAPHNLFVGMPAALRSATARGAEPLERIGWTFTDVAPAGSDGPGRYLDIAMSTSYRTSWSYDSAAGLYRRQQNGVEATVTGSGEIGAANVVVLATRHYVGDSGYPETDVVGHGDALVLRDGQRFVARWSKATITDPIAIQTADGASFPLKPGVTWIHLPDRLPHGD